MIESKLENVARVCQLPFREEVRVGMRIFETNRIDYLNLEKQSLVLPRRQSSHFYINSKR